MHAGCRKPSALSLTLYFKHYYSNIWILRNQPLETQCWNWAQFLRSY